MQGLPLPIRCQEHRCVAQGQVEQQGVPFGLLPPAIMPSAMSGSPDMPLSMAAGRLSPASWRSRTSLGAEMPVQKTAQDDLFLLHQLLQMPQERNRRLFPISDIELQHQIPDCQGLLCYQGVPLRKALLQLPVSLKIGKGMAEARPESRVPSLKASNAL